ncbi:MAG: hypothetical protein AAB116_04160, partial [Candidatus Poribacteria bacterium]
RNINRRNFNLSIWRENGTDSFQTDEGPVLYNRIFGLDSDGDGLVDPELVDFDKGTLTFRTPKPFIISDSTSPYYKYSDQLNNEAIYSENPQYTDEKYVIQADYSYQTPSFYLGRLNILPNSEEVRVNGKILKRSVDYIMVYEVGSVEIFKELDEYDDIKIDYEYMPFGGQFQQTIAGIWADYTYIPKKKKEEMQKKDATAQPDQSQGRPQGIPYGDTNTPYTQNTGNFGSDYRSNSNGYSNNDNSSYGNTYGSNYGSSYGSDYGGSYSGYDSYGGNSSYGGGSDGYSYYGGRRGRLGSYSGYGGTKARGIGNSGYASGGRGLNLSLGYIYNAGQRSTDIPDVNSAPNRLQALIMNGTWGHEFNVARVIGLIPFVSIRGKVPWSISINGEAAYSRNNPNSVGYAMIDSMEGAKESSRISPYKFSWKVGGAPFSSETNASTDNRVIFQIAKKDKEASFGNYMKNREVSASELNSLSTILQQYQVMEIGYELDENTPWGGLSYSISASGSDFSKYESLEVWLKVDGDNNIRLNIDLGTVSEDADNDYVLDSEDLPADLKDANGDHKIDILDLDKKNLSVKDKYKGNGSLDLGEDIGWQYNSNGGNEEAKVGSDNSILDSEDLDGDVVLDTTDSYYEFSIPLNEIPSEWIRRENKDSGWIFLSIPIGSAKPEGRSPSWGVIKQARVWIEKAVPGLVAGKLQWYSISVVGNRWEKGLVVDSAGKLSQNAEDKVSVGTKNNYEFDDYLKEYKTIENDKDFMALHPYIESALSLESQKQEQALTMTYKLQPNTTGYTMRELSGLRRGDGQDFSRHRNIRFWVHGDGSKATLVLRLGGNVDDFGAGSPITKTETDNETDTIYSYYSYSRIGGRGYYEWTKTIDWTGWRLITIPLDDNNDDGPPDSLKPVNDPSITT